MLDIRQREYQAPTPIQAQGIPLVLSGRDVLGCAETGSGKTASFAIPMIQQCINSPPLRRGDGPIGLVLAPTRELAQQVRLREEDASRSRLGSGLGVELTAHLSERLLQYPSPLSPSSLLADW